MNFPFASPFLHLLMGIAILISMASAVEANEDWRVQLEPLLRANCMDCHDATAEAGLNLGKLGADLTDPSNFRKWERVFERVDRGEMPPESEDRPAPALLKTSLQHLEAQLLAANEKVQKEAGRTVLRRLTRTEYEFLVNDLFGIDGDLASLIPEENSSGYDTVANTQGLSPQHIRGYFDAADRAIDLAIRLDPPPPENHLLRVEYKEHPGIRKHIDGKEEHVVIGETDDAIIMFNNASYLFKVPEFHADGQGRYRMRAEVSGYQSEKPVIFTLNFGDYKRGMQQIIKAFDLEAGKTRIVEAEFMLEAGQYLFPGTLNLENQPDGKSIWNVGPDEYTGSGVLIKWIEVEGPLNDAWPPKCTTDLLAGMEIKKFDSKQWNHQQQRHFQYAIVAGDDPAAQLTSLVNRVAPRAFQRPLQVGEAEEFVQLGAANFEQSMQDENANAGRAMDNAVRIVLRSILTSPQFLFRSPTPGRLDDYALASRLSMFFWKSLPDEELSEMARDGKLSEPAVLHEQVERMLDDSKSNRMVRDFSGQWLRLYDIEATSPDMRLYPEYDNLLQQAMLDETESFLAHLIAHDLSSDCIVDANFTFVNRRLAEHYGIDGVVGQEMRRIELPLSSPRGGLLTQASVLKVTANGTTTSPVRRGSWVLARILGTPPNPPPPSVGSIEPDTRGTTTIRELLDKHRNDATCASCHRSIDPPGFALESFDVIGGYRERFRSQEVGDRPQATLHGRDIWEYKLGQTVDASGVLPNGEVFSDIQEFKALLLKQREQVARNLIQQWVVYSTGAEIEFADRADIDMLVAECRDSEFGLRTILHRIVQSDLFRNK